MFDAASRGRYSTDASIYQIQPIGVVVPRSEEAARAAIAIAVEEGIPILPRGAGSSQCGQAVGEALVIDHTKYLNRALQVDPEIRRAIVQPGMVLDTLNAQLRKHGLWFPVDVSTSAQATIGGMTGNNSCGSRSIAYGNMVHNVLAVDAFTTSGERWHFGPMDQNLSGSYGEFIARLKGLYQREKAGNRSALSESAAQGRRLQPRPSRPAARQRRASAGRLRRHARVLGTHSPEARAACPRSARSAYATSRSSTPRWSSRSTS